MTVRELISAALRGLGVIAVGETPTDAEMRDGLEALNLMLQGWALERLTVFTATGENFTLTAGTAEYSIGSSGDFDTARPQSIAGAWVRDNQGLEHKVRLISELQYRNIADKTVQGRPSMLFYDPEHPLGRIYLYPTPDAAETLHLESLKPFTALDGLSQEVSLPPGYAQALKWNLALELAPEFGKQPDQVVAAKAVSSKSFIKRNVAAAALEPASPGFVGDTVWNYNEG